VTRSHRLLSFGTGAFLLIASPSAHAQSATLLRLANPANADRLVADSSGLTILRGPFSGGALAAPAAGALMMWYPRKAAFRAGAVGSTQWHDASVGAYSFATGQSTTASGTHSVATGGSSTATGIGAVSMGMSTSASGNRSVAMGSSNVASGYASTAFGDANDATADYATAFGRNSTASGAGSLAMGLSVTASGANSIALGTYASTNAKIGAFIFGDASSVTTITSPDHNSFVVR
jgi:trimeric autotransporter adhesin